tara:strand:- start:2389 stop:2739 length:351 start_codon:yes stop_codon:yes gene_type:complete
MNAEKAIEKLKLKQERMMAEAQRMTLRADKLKKVAEFQTNFKDRRWVVDALDIDGLIARSMVLRDAESGILVRASLQVDLEILSDGFDGHITDFALGKVGAPTIIPVKNFIGGEEE